MANGTIILNQQHAIQLFDDLASIEQTIGEIRRSLAKFLPAAYGSHTWWEKSDAQALKSIQNGQGKKFSSVVGTIQYLHS